MITDTDIVALCEKDKVLALRCLVRSYYSSLLLVAMTELNDRDLAERIVGDLFWKFCIEDKPLRIVQPLRPLLYNRLLVACRAFGLNRTGKLYI